MSDARQDDLELFVDLPESGETQQGETPAGEPDAFRNRSVSGEQQYNNSFIEDYRAAGAYLRKCRENLGITPEMVDAETRIQARLLHALENGDLDELPQPVYPVYVVACLKKLGKMYQIDDETLIEITEGLKKQIQCQAPDDISKSCFGHEVNEESLRREKRLIAMLLTAGGVLLLLLAAGIIFLIAMLLREPDPVVNTPFDENVLLEIQKPVKLKVTPLPVVEN